MTTFRAAFLFALAFPPTRCTADEPRPAIAIRLDRPDLQARAVIDLFRGSKAPHPAAALAAWKRASREPNRLGKPTEALIAAFNPAMVGELRTIDRAEVALWFELEGQVAWGASLPNDDGTFAALATAFVLSGGAAEDPMDGLAVDRLGPPGSALMARAPRALLLAGSRDGLKDARARSSLPRGQDPGQPLQLSVEPEALDGSRSLAIRRLKAALGEPGRSIAGTAGLEGSTLRATIEVAARNPAHPAAVEPEWLDWIPSERASGAFALAVDPSAENWDALFRLADRVERVDPLREDVAPIRLRIGLLSRAVGLRTDSDLLPHLKGIAGWFGSGESAIEGAFLMLHLDGEAAASRVFERIKPLPNSGRAPDARPDSGRWLGQLDGRPLRLFRVGTAVVVAWGDDVMEASRGAREHPERSAGRVLRESRIEPRSVLVGALWPARVPGLVPSGSPLARALNASPPVTWTGAWKDAKAFHLAATWKGLDATIRRFLDLIPFDSPPDR